MEKNEKDIPYLNDKIDDLDGEIWEDVIGYDGIYLVSNLGRVKSLRSDRIMKQQVSRSNFNNLKPPSKGLKVSFSVNGVKKTHCVSVLVGMAFIGQPKMNQVFSKKDKCWNNNKADNLEITTISNCFKLAYKKGNNLRKKTHLTRNHKNLFIYTRLSDGKNFTGTELFAEYKKEIRSNLRKAIKKNSVAYGSKWSREPA